jgi:hypothetical protein
VVSANSSNQLWRTAIKFKGSVPIWDAWCEHGGLLFYVSRATGEFDLSGTYVQVWVRPLQTTWGDTYSVAQMNTVWGAAGGSYKAVNVYKEGWYYLPLQNLGAVPIDDFVDYGVGLSVLTSGNVGSAFIPVAYGLQPQIRLFLGLDWPCEDNGYSAAGDFSFERPDLSAKALAQIQRDSMKWKAELELSANLAKTDSAESDASLSSDLSILGMSDWASQEIQLPETWSLKDSNPGGITLRDSGAATPAQLEGTELTLDFYLRDGLGTRELVNSFRSRVKRAGRRLGQKMDLGLEDILASYREATTHRILPIHGDRVEYEDEQALRIIWDMLVNSPRRVRTGVFDYHDSYEQGAYTGDWFWLYQRFVGTWMLLSYTTTELEDFTAKSLTESLAITLGLFIGSGHDGRIHVFHPAVYRPSMRVWELDISKHVQRGQAVLKRHVPHAAGLETYSPNYPIEVYGRTPLSNIEMGYTITNIELPLDYWQYTIMREMCKWAILRQLAPRYCDAPDVLTLVAGHRTLPWSAGDQVKITSETYELEDEPFLVLSREKGPTESQAQFTLYRWPYWKGAHSLFQEDTPRGIWRWVDEDHNLDFANRAWGENREGSVEWTALANPPEFVFECWQAPLINLAASSGGDVVEIKSDAISPATTGAVTPKVDILELQYSVRGAPYSFTVRDTFQDWPLCWWMDSSGTKALAFFIRRDPWPPPPNPTCEESRYCLGYTTDITSYPISWSWVIEAPNGCGQRGTTSSGWPTDFLAMGLEEGVAHFYINGDHIGKATYTRDTDLDEIHIRASGNDKTGFAVCRVLRREGLPERGELTAVDGEDPYYP